MREILFRGKTLQPDEWIYGDARVLKAPEIGTCILRGGGYYWVLPETFGQYTGIKDKNGKRIFEGDILKFDWKDDEKYIGEVVWNDEYACFDIISTNEKVCPYFGIMDAREFEVVGNRIDNPELLEA